MAGYKATDNAVSQNNIGRGRDRWEKRRASQGTAANLAAHEAASNPHPVYLTEAEGDAMYDILGAAAAAQAAAQAYSDAAFVAHLAAGDPHPQYLTAAEGDALFLTPAEGNAAYDALGSAAAAQAASQPLDGDLTALAAIATNGFLVHSAANTIITRNITGQANEITVNNGNGIAGNAGISLPAALTFTGKTVTGGTFTTNAITLSAITASSVNNSPIGGVTPAAGAFTTVTGSGQATFALGSVGAPAYSFVGDTNTGVLSPGADRVAVATAGVSGLEVDASQRVLAPLIHNNASGTTGTTPAIQSGTYTPTITNSTNVAASTAGTAHWLRVGNIVHVNGRCTIDPTSASIQTIWTLSLPLASNFAAVTDCYGVTNGDTFSAFTAAGIVSASVGGDSALFAAYPASTANQTFYYQYSYNVL